MKEKKHSTYEQELARERHRNHELKHRLEILQASMDEFTYFVSHDLQAPIRAIASLSTWLKEDYVDILDEEGANLVSLLAGQSKSLSQMVEALRSYSQIGRVVQKKQVIDLNELVKSIVEALQTSDDVQVKIMHPLPTVVGEPLRLEQLFFYLLDNAFQYCDYEVGVIEISGSESEASYRIEIRDYGPGISAKYHDRVFKIFQRLKTNDESDHLGMGLTLAKKIVETHGGEIGIRSSVGTGTTVYFTLPKKPLETEFEYVNSLDRQ